MIMLHYFQALVCIVIMGGARAYGTFENATIAKMEVVPTLPPSSASQWWANAPLQQIDLRKIFDGSTTTSGPLYDERTSTFGPNAHQAPLPGPNNSAVEKRLTQVTRDRRGGDEMHAQGYPPPAAVRGPYVAKTGGP